TGPLWPVGVSVGCTVATSQPRSAWPPPDEASSLPSGLKATHRTPKSRHARVCSSLPVAAFHTLTVLSSPLARRVPSGLKATQVTSPVCPRKVARSWPVAASHTFSVPAKDAL